jgi:hypothetical protein
VQCVLYPVRLLRNLRETVQCVLHPFGSWGIHKKLCDAFRILFSSWGIQKNLCIIPSICDLELEQEPVKFVLYHSALEELTRIRAIRSVSYSALEEFTRICAFLLCPVRLLRNSQEWSVLSLYIRFGSWAIHSSCNFLLRECGSWRKQEEAATKIKGCREEGFMTQWSHLENVFPAVFCMSWEQHMVCIWSTDDCKGCWIQQIMRRNVNWLQSFCAFWGGKEFAKLVLFSGRMYNTEEWSVWNGELSKAYLCYGVIHHQISVVAFRTPSLLEWCTMRVSTGWWISRCLQGTLFYSHSCCI